MRGFRSSLPQLPDSFILIFRIYDVMISLILLFPLFLCVAAALGGFLSGDLPSILFSVALLAIACYLALMIYAFSLDFRSCDFDGLWISEGFASFMLREKAKRRIPLDSVSSITLVRIRLFLPYAFYVEFRTESGSMVAEVAEKDMESLSEALVKAGFREAPSRSIPFYLHSKELRR